MHEKYSTLLSVGLMVSGLGLLGVQPALADDAQTLARNSGCMACHSVDTKVVGPAFKDVAAKYKGDAKAKAALVAKVKAGGSGVWGTIPMPPNAQVSDQDIETLVVWVLGQ